MVWGRFLITAYVKRDYLLWLLLYMPLPILINDAPTTNRKIATVFEVPLTMAIMLQTSEAIKTRTPNICNNNPIKIPSDKRIK